VINSPLAQAQEGRHLTEKDVPAIKHHFRRIYGWINEQDWGNYPLNELFADYVFVQEEIKKQEELRLCTLKFYGVKNPK
jgi:hypothetical protein